MENTLNETPRIEVPDPKKTLHGAIRKLHSQVTRLEAAIFGDVPKKEVSALSGGDNITRALNAIEKMIGTVSKCAERSEEIGN
jgi:hypothetical protein